MSEPGEPRDEVSRASGEGALSEPGEPRDEVSRASGEGALSEPGEPRDASPPPVQPVSGGWPDPAPDSEEAGALGWPDARDEELNPPGESAGSDEDQLDAWLDEREAAAGDAVAAPHAEQADGAAEAPQADRPGDVEEPSWSPRGLAVDEAGDPHAEAIPGEAWALDDQPESAEPTDPGEESVLAPGGDRPRALTITLAALVAVLVGVDVFLGVAAVRTRGIGADEEGRRDAVGAARNAARLVFSYDYRRLDQDFKAGLATTTGDFRDEYTRTTAALKKDGVPGRYKAVVVSDVSEAGVVTGDSDRAEVLVFVNQQSASTLTQVPKITQSRVVLQMVNRDGRWLVEKIKAL